MPEIVHEILNRTGAVDCYLFMTRGESDWHYQTLVTIAIHYILEASAVPSALPMWRGAVRLQQANQHKWLSKRWRHR